MAIRSIEEAKTEAVKRLEVLKVHENVRNEFLEEKLNKSEHNGALYWLKNEEKVINNTFPDCTEFGCIGVKPLFGGITRIW